MRSIDIRMREETPLPQVGRIVSLDCRQIQWRAAARTLRVEYRQYWYVRTCVLYSTCVPQCVRKTCGGARTHVQYCSSVRASETRLSLTACVGCVDCGLWDLHSPRSTGSIRRQGWSARRASGRTHKFCVQKCALIRRGIRSQCLHCSF